MSIMHEINCHPMRFLVDPVGKPPLLLMHGFLSSRNHWRLNERALRSRYRLIIAELPGHGETARCDPADVTPDALAQSFERARLELDIPRWHICGQSFGAGLVLRYALSYPQHVGALVWTNANRVLSESLSQEDISSLQQRAAKVEAGGLEAIRKERVYPGSARYFPSEMRELLARDADGCDPMVVTAILRKSLGFVSVRDRFPELRMPTLLVNGLRERSFQEKRNLAVELLPTMEVVDLDGGHSINIEQPDGFDAAVLEFLGRHDGLLADDEISALSGTQ